MAMPDPRHAYVRFYLSVLDDLDGAMSAVVRARAGLQTSVAPFNDAVTACGVGPLVEPTGGLPDTRALWRPSDPVDLTGLTDVYEVVGRFSFQGEDDATIHAVGAFTSALAAETRRLRAWVKSLGDVPAATGRRAEALAAQDQASVRAQQADALKQFEPVATELRTLCGTLLEALRAARRPELTRADAAEGLYQDYVSRVRGLYARALPYLRSELAELSRVAGCDVPPSWPDTLPFADALPPDLVNLAVVESPALAQARAAVEALMAQEAALARAHDELGVQLRRVESEATTLAQRDGETAREIAVAGTVVRWATRLDEADAVRVQAGGLQAEALQRGQQSAQIQAEGQRVAAQSAAIQAEATEWAQLVSARDQAFARHRESEPALFGKDDWRRKLDELEGEANDARTELARRQQTLQAMQAELGRLRVRDQSEQAQIAALHRAVEESRTREATVQRAVADLERELGASRPARRLTVAQAEAALAMVMNARAEARARTERLGADARRIREDQDRAAVQLRQVTAERQRQQPLVAQASQQAAVAQDDAVRVLASRRQAAFESHVNAVLAGLEESLAQVERVFIEPARRILLERTGASSVAPAALRAQGDALAAALPEIQGTLEAALVPVDTTLDRVDREFVARAPEACRSAWTTMDSPSL